MTRRGALPRVVRDALRSPGGHCYRHCDGPVRSYRLSSPLPGLWQVRACPAGVVSVTTYAEWTGKDTTRAVRRVLQQWTSPPSLVRTRDLRWATRHGPELGRAAERFLARARPRRPVRVVYWRVYPSKSRDGTERRLFVCFRRSHAGPVFYLAAPQDPDRTCPACARPRAATRRRSR